jgi:HK97 gp10 family phage protein
MAVLRNTEHISGLSELERALNQLPQEIAKGSVRKGLRAAGNVWKAEINKQVRSLPGPYRRLKLKANIAVAVQRYYKKKGNLVARVRWKSAAGEDRDKSKFPFYWHWVEFGRDPGCATSSSGRRVCWGRLPPRRPMLTAFNISTRRAIDAFMETTAKSVPLEIQRVARRNARRR